MNCIYCNNRLANVPDSSDRYICQYCHVSFLIEHTPTIEDENIYSIQFYYDNAYQYSSLTIDIDWGTISFRPNPGDPIITINKLYWLFPSNVYKFMSRFKRLLVFS